MPRVLLVKTSSLGDVVHNLPVVSELVAAVPGVTIDWVVAEDFAAIPRLHPQESQPLRVSLVPVEAPAQKQSLGRPRYLFGSHHREAQAPKVRPVADDSQPELASHGPPCRLHGGHSFRTTG